MNKHTPTFNAWQNLENAIRSADIASFDIQTAEKLFNYPKRNRNKMSMAEFTQIFGILQKKNIPKLKPVLLEFRQLFANNCVGTGEIDPELLKCFQTVNNPPKEKGNNTMSTILGIDLGTTNSCVAYVNDADRPEILCNPQGANITPSVIFFEGEGVIVGEEAKNAWASSPENTVAFVKRSMTGETQRNFPQNHDAVTLSAIILRTLVKWANEALGRPEDDPVTDVVITVPAYFNNEAKARTKEAGKIAGLNVLGLLTEPTAAAISYGIDKNQDQTVMVYDLGGGTFDVTVIQIRNNSFDVICVDGDQAMGGFEWDQRLAQHILEHYNNAFGTEFVFPSTENQLSNAEPKIQRMHASLMTEAEKIKKALTASRRETARTTWLFEEDGHTLPPTEITRTQFDEMTGDLLEITLNRVDEVLNTAREKGVTRIDKLLLVGGSSLMPQVKDALANKFPNIEIIQQDPHMCVAKGAAIFAQTLGNQEPGSDGPKIHDVSAHTYGTDCLSNGVPKVRNMIFKDTPLPAEKEVTFMTNSPNATGVRVDVYESDETDDLIEPDFATVLARNQLMRIRNPRPEKVRVHVKFSVDTDGILHIYSRTDDNDELEYTLNISGVTTDDTELMEKQACVEELTRDA